MERLEEEAKIEAGFKAIEYIETAIISIKADMDEFVAPDDSQRTYFMIYKIINAYIKKYSPTQEELERRFKSFASFYLRDETSFDVRFIYLINQIVPGCVDFNHYAMSCLAAGRNIYAATSQKLYTAVETVEMLIWYDSFDIKSLFTANNKEVQTQISTLLEQKTECKKNYLLDPTESDDMFKFTNMNLSEDQYWKADGISLVKKPAFGERTMATYQQFLRNFQHFTGGIFDKSPNPEIDSFQQFDWSGVCIAGGSGLQMMEEPYLPKRSSDIDLFIYGPNAKQSSKKIQYLLNWFSSPKTYFGVIGSVISVYIVDYPRVIQIVCSNDSCIYDIISRFDLSHIQWAISKSTLAEEQKLIEGTKEARRNRRNQQEEPATMSKDLNVFATPHAMYSMRNKISTIRNSNRLNLARYIKTLFRGYSIDKRHSIIQNEKEFDLDTLLKNNLSDYKRDYYTYYTPTSDSIKDMSEEEAEQYILGMITVHSNCNIISKDTILINNSVVPFGNFDYGSSSFVNFKPEIIKVSRNRICQDKHGKKITLQSSICKVYDIMLEESSMTVLLETTDPDFIKFLSLLDTEVYGMMQRHDNDNKRPVLFVKDKRNLFKVVVGKFKLDNGSIFKNDQNEELNIAEDLEKDQDVKVIFNIGNADRNIHIHPIKIILITKSGAPEEDPEDKEDKEDETPKDNKIPFGKQEIQVPRPMFVHPAKQPLIPAPKPTPVQVLNAIRESKNPKESKYDNDAEESNESDEEFEKGQDVVDDADYEQVNLN